MKFELFVALRYLRAKRKQTMVSVVSTISVLGIAAGVMALVIALALSTGFKEDVQGKILGTTSAINLFQINGSPIRSYEKLLRRLSSLAHVTGSAPAIFKEVFIASPHSNQGAALKGVDPNLEMDVSDFFSHIIAGDFHALDRPYESSPDSHSPRIENILVGNEMARTLGVGVGDSLTVFYPMGRLTPLGMSFSEKKMRIAAIFKSGLWDIDANWAYVNIQTARRLFSYPPGSALTIQFKSMTLKRQKPLPRTYARRPVRDLLPIHGSNKTSRFSRLSSSRNWRCSLPSASSFLWPPSTS
jgi:lipoprotein-releasing system permease protein